MDALELNGVTYVKATAIARELGYTADYVGQLCRGGKVDAQLVGRSWYVSEASIRDHKKSRYRSNKAKAASALKETISVKEDKAEADEKVAVHPYFQDAPKHFYARTPEPTTHYTEDQTELIPTLTKRESHMKPAEVEVTHADAKPVAVVKKGGSYDLIPTERPKIRFKGEVTIVEPAEPEEKTEKTTAKTVHPTEEPAKTKVKVHIEKEEPEKKEKPKKEEPRQEEQTNVKIRKEATPKQTQPVDTVRRSGSRLAVRGEAGETKTTEAPKITLERGTAVSMTLKSVQPKLQGELKVEAMQVSEVAKNTGRFTFAYITASLLLALLLGAGFMLLESSVVATNDSVDTEYNVNVSSVLDSIHGLK